MTECDEMTDSTARIASLFSSPESKLSMNQSTPSQHSIVEIIQAHDFDAVSAAGSSAIGPLLRAWRGKDRVVGQWAYQALRRLGKRAIPGLLRSLSDPSASIRHDAACMAGLIKDRDTTEALIGVLHDEDASVRVQAAQALGQIGDDRAVEPLIRLLNDPDRNVAHHAAIALMHIGVPAILPLTQALANREQDEIVRWRSAYTLGRIRTPQSLGTLIQILKDQSQPSYVRQGAAAGLSNFGGNQVVDTLIETLADSDGAVRANATYALGQYARSQKGLVDKRPVELLIRVLRDDDNSRARWMAALALQFFYDERALPILLSLRRVEATSRKEKRIKEAAGFVVRNMRHVERRRAANMDATQRDGNVP